MSFSTCPHCGNTVPGGSEKCPFCGYFQESRKELKAKVRQRQTGSSFFQRASLAETVDNSQTVVRCPHCGSTQIQAVKKGFGFGKAVAGAAVAGPFGLLAGGIGAGKVQRVCLACGKKF